MELEEVSGEFVPVQDRRVRLPEPLPVRLIAVEDVRLETAAGLESQLDEFYVDLLAFERVEGELAYRADNFILRFALYETMPQRDSLRPLGIEVISLREAEQKLIERELPYVRQRGITPGRDVLVLLDPAGNWIEISEARVVG